jgi:hypothetical protein
MKEKSKKNSCHPRTHAPPHHNHRGEGGEFWVRLREHRVKKQISKLRLSNLKPTVVVEWLIV